MTFYQEKDPPHNESEEGLIEYLLELVNVIIALHNPQTEYAVES